MLAPLLLSALPSFGLFLLTPFPQGEDRNVAFSEGFEKAVRMREMEDMDRLIKRYTDEAINAFVVKADERAISPGGGLGNWVDNFVESWGRTFRNDFARNYDRFLQLRIHGDLRQIRGDTINGPYYEAVVGHAIALGSKDEDDWRTVRAMAEVCVNAFEQCGDTYFASKAAFVLGNSWNPDFNPDGGNAQKALDAYKQVMHFRGKCLLSQDKNYTETKACIRILESALGLGEEVGAAPKSAGDRVVLSIPPAEGAEWHAFALEPDADSKLNKVVHSNDWADNHRMSWPFAGTGEVGTSTKLWFFDPPVFVKRIDKNEFVVEAGAKPSKPFKLSLKPKVVPFNRLIDDQEIPHAIAFAGGSERDPLHGQEMNFSISDKAATFFFRPVSTRTAKTPFGPLTIWDLDCDGYYGLAESALPRAYVGVPLDTFFYRHDAIMLGKGKRSLPYCRWISDSSGNWYEVELMSHQEGKEAQIRQVSPVLGKAKLSFKGVKDLKLVSLVLESDSGKTKGLLVDLLAQRKEVALPAGRYKFQMGILRNKKGDEEALLLPPTALALTWDIAPGETTEIKLGGPFDLAVQPKVEGNVMTLDGASLVVTGKAGERYLRLVGAPLFGVEVEVKGNKKANTEFKGSNAQEMNNNFLYAYQPQDAIIPFKGDSAPPYRLTLNKHPWFGNIQTDWIE
ncbi:MAG: hypothetical protein QF389_09710 [Planctomycetota bacterium]|nr:hypothetical protein [Planctomycetota bacterium]|tara:strand:- start:8247 stop:10283 length:2037 start_codon:yes stop_codon:yes gene_type:complete